MKILLDMNLSPDWCTTLQTGGHEAMHWSKVGAPGASDHEIMKWAADNDYVVFTHDLDFSAILSATQAAAPSVLQIRTQSPTPQHMGTQVLAVIDQFQAQLSAGAIVVFDETRARVRVLPIRR